MNGIIRIGFIIIGVLKIIGLLILNKFGMNDNLFNFFRNLDLENINIIIKVNVEFDLLIYMNYWINCFVNKFGNWCVFFVVVNIFIFLRIVEFYIGWIIGFKIVGLCILND